MAEALTREAKRNGLPLIVLIVIPLIASWPILSGWLTVDPIYTISALGHSAGALRGIPQLDPNVGLTTQSLGHLAAEDWLDGRLPWWNPFSGIGLPLSAEGQNPALLFPFVLLLAVHNGPFLLKLALQEVAIVSTFLLLRQMALTRLAAAVGATIFALNGTFAWFGDAPIMPIAFMPLVLLGIERAWASAQALQSPARWRGWPLAAVALALSVTAGFPETTYLDSLLVLAWSLVRLSDCRPGARARFFGSLILAALTGILLASPFILPFATLLSVGDAGMHAASGKALAGGIAHLATPRAALGLLVMPYLFGPLTAFAQDDATRLVSDVWDYLGGYVSLLVLFLALLALLARRDSTSRLRWMLAIWCCVIIGTSFGLPGLTKAIYALPLLGQTQIFRYSPPSWEFAFAILAAYAVNDWCIRKTSWRPLATATILTMAAFAVVLLLAKRQILYLAGSTPGYQKWLIFSCAEALGLVSLTALALWLLPGPRSRALLFGAAILNYVLLSSIPMLSGYAHPQLDNGGVDFLKAHLGSDRFYTLGPIRPNYAAFFQIESINSDYLPAPKLWTDYIRTYLDPTSDPLSFSGQGQLPGKPVPDHGLELRKNLAAYRNIGVRYIVSPVGEDGLDNAFRNPVIPPTVSARILASNDRLETIISPGELRAVMLDAISVQVGTFDGKSRGILSLRACIAAMCRDGKADLSAAADNQPLPIHFQTPLPLSATAPLSLSFTYRGPTNLALWLYHDQATGKTSPALGFIYEGNGPNHPTVFSDGHMTIDDLGASAPYFEALGGHCQLTAQGRNGLVANCTSAAKLIRRVLWYPGWRATLNGQPIGLQRAAPIFQSLALPQGLSIIRFSYQPPHARTIATAFLLGWVMVFGGILWPFSKWNRRHAA